MNTTLNQITIPYKKQFIDDIIEGMSLTLNNSQLMELNRSLNAHTANLTIIENPESTDLNYEETNKNLIKYFIKSKKLKGLSSKSLKYYESQLQKLEEYAIKSFIEFTADDLKEYLRFGQEINQWSKVTLNNVRRILSSFWKWMELEEIIIINPMKRIPSVKQPKYVRKAFTDEEIEILRLEIDKHPNAIRNHAIFEMLLSSGLRLSEITSLKKEDVNLVDCKGVVMGKGAKERVFYFSERTKQYILSYFKLRKDNKQWLFVSSNAPFNKLGQSGISTIIRELGVNAGVTNVHPHRFRRTMATKLVRKGMPLEQVSELLGHSSLSVTMRYVETDNELLKLIHDKHTN